MSNILNIWKGRTLTLFGKNLLINSLSNSLFLFNAQIETPPTDFIKSAEKLHKEFLWGGTPKISHHTIISDYSKGGIRYKDLNDFISAIKIRNILRLPLHSEGSHTVLPIFWIKTLFKIPIGAKNVGDSHYEKFFQKSLSILDCLYQLPRKNHYTGHPYYYDALKDLEKMSTKVGRNIENILSIPIWYNRFLKTKFDSEISMAGFNFLKDIFPENKQIEALHGLTGYKSRKLKNIIDKVPPDWKSQIATSLNCCVTVYPAKILRLNGEDRRLKEMQGNQLYNALIGNKTRFPRGLLKWREDFELSDANIRYAFTSLHRYLSSASDQAFQYKILTNILPTNEYLCRYKVLNSSLCSRCGSESDTILHSIWSCRLVLPYVSQVLNYLRSHCQVKDTEVTAKPYIFGGQNMGLNHIFLQLKKELFYNKELDLTPDAFCELFMSKMRKTMIKEKVIFIQNSKFDLYNRKWSMFKHIYDYMGPDINDMF